MRIELAIACLVVGGVLAQTAPGDDYLRWSSGDAERIGRSTYQQGRVGGIWDTRVLKTERAHNYKLAATWLTPDVIRATARLLQLRSRMSETAARDLVTEAETGIDTAFIVELDPREGSGVIPRDWEAFLQVKDRPDTSVRGTIEPRLRDVRALAGVLRRNYDYDRFWVTFSTTADGKPLFGPGDRVAQLIVRIHDKEGRVEWPVPASMTRP
jgi:glycine/D-amino acid oxidase-like deaminating enzyme